MPRTLLVLAALVAALLLIGSAAPVAAQSQNQTAPNVSAEPGTERIDEQTTLINSGYDDDLEMAYLEIRSESLQEVTLTDAGAFMEGGEIAQRTTMMKPDETATLKIPVTKVDGFVGVSVSTPNTLYAVPIETSTQIFDGAATWETVQTAGVVGFVGGLLAVMLVSLAKVRGGRTEVDQVA